MFVMPGKNPSLLLPKKVFWANSEIWKEQARGWRKFSTDRTVERKKLRREETARFVSAARGGRVGTSRGRM